MLRAAALVVVLGFALSGCSAITGRPFLQWSDDKLLTAQVKSRLMGVSVRTVSRVNVDTYDGTVYLSGIVRSAHHKQRVEEAARSVDGVRQVVSHLVARETGDDGPSAAALPVAALERPVPVALVGVARLDGSRAYDAAGRQVATVFTVPMGELAHANAARFDGPEPIGHVTVHAVDADAHIPMPHYLIVLWHRSPLAPVASPR